MSDIESKPLFVQKDFDLVQKISDILNVKNRYDRADSSHEKLREDVQNGVIKKLQKLSDFITESVGIHPHAKKRGTSQCTQGTAWKYDYWKPFSKSKDYDGLYAIKIYFPFDKQNLTISVGTIDSDETWEKERNTMFQHNIKPVDTIIKRQGLLTLSQAELKSEIKNAVEINIPIYNQILALGDTKPNEKIDSDNEYNDLIPYQYLNQILYGPPGTGKTYSIIKEVNKIRALGIYNQPAVDSIKNLQKKDYTLAFTTFHPAYGYEEFIEGIRPNLNKGTISYHIHDGVFKELCDLAKDKPEEPYFMIIDEINRGNIPKIFGELITLIEYNKRAGNDEEISVTLPYSRNSFTVPKNVHIIGTMNTADKSLTALDTALRRRFTFIEMMPKPELIAKDSNGIINSITVRNLLTKINENIEKQGFERSHHIGHAFFMSCKNEQDVIDALAYKIIPLLQEYTYDDWEKMSKILFSDKDEMKKLVKTKNSDEQSNFELIASEVINRYKPIKDVPESEKIPENENAKNEQEMDLDSITGNDVSNKNILKIQIGSQEITGDQSINTFVNVYKYLIKATPEFQDELVEKHDHFSTDEDEFKKDKSSPIKIADNLWYDANRDNISKIKDLIKVGEILEIHDQVSVFVSGQIKK